jgi:hypothetical protein
VILTQASCLLKSGKIRTEDNEENQGSSPRNTPNTRKSLGAQEFFSEFGVFSRLPRRSFMAKAGV